MQCEIDEQGDILDDLVRLLSALFSYDPIGGLLPEKIIYASDSTNPFTLNLKKTSARLKSFSLKVKYVLLYFAESGS